jgi:hypothetical protein
MTLRCLWVASNENAERVLGGLENNTKSALAVKLLIVASSNIAVLLPISVFLGWSECTARLSSQRKSESSTVVREGAD